MVVAQRNTTNLTQSERNRKDTSRGSKNDDRTRSTKYFSFLRPISCILRQSNSRSSYNRWGKSPRTELKVGTSPPSSPDSTALIPSDILGNSSNCSILSSDFNTQIVPSPSRDDSEYAKSWTQSSKILFPYWANERITH